LESQAVPLIVMSAGLGDIIEAMFRQHHAGFSGLHVIANRYDFDQYGLVVGNSEPVIHTFNKNDVTLHGLPDYEAIRRRRNVVLLGDSASDPEMVIGFDYDHLLKVGLLNEKVEERLPAFRAAYDVVVIGDGGLEPVINLLEQILTVTTTI